MQSHRGPNLKKTGSEILNLTSSAQAEGNYFSFAVSTTSISTVF